MDGTKYGQGPALDESPHSWGGLGIRRVTTHMHQTSLHTYRGTKTEGGSQTEEVSNEGFEMEMENETREARGLGWQKLE